MIFTGHILKRWSLALTLLCTIPAAAVEPLRVVASIQPLALMVRAVGADQVTTEVLLDAGQSPHDFSLKMSDRRKLAAAELVVWIGPAMEPYLNGLVTSGNAVALELILDRLGQFDDGPAVGAVASHHPHEHGDDRHLWLDPVAGAALLDELGLALGRLAPAQAALFRERAATAADAVLQLQQQYQPPPVRRQYAVAHDAYAQFVNGFGLPQPLVIADSPEMAPGVRTLVQVGAQLQPGDCLLVDRNHRRKWIEKFADDYKLRLLEVDIMGVGPTIKSYTELLAGLLAIFTSCQQ